MQPDIEPVMRRPLTTGVVFDGYQLEAYNEMLSGSTPVLDFLVPTTDNAKKRYNAKKQKDKLGVLSFLKTGIADGNRGTTAFRNEAGDLQLTGAAIRLTFSSDTATEVIFTLRGRTMTAQRSRISAFRKELVAFAEQQGYHLVFTAKITEVPFKYESGSVRVYVYKWPKRQIVDDTELLTATVRNIRPIEENENEDDEDDNCQCEECIRFESQE